MTNGNQAIELLREQFQAAHTQWLEPTVQDLTRDQVRWQPAGRALPAGAHWAHAVVSEDVTIQGMLRGGTPLAMGEWSERTGLSELPPQGGDWSDWARRVDVDGSQLRAYAGAVSAATDAWLASLSADDLRREVDLSALGLGTQPMSFVVNGVLLNVVAHCGEVSCLKGLQGSQGYAV